MARYGYVGTAVGGEDAVKGPLGPDVLICVGLAVESHPELIVLGEAGLDPVGREKIADVALAAASVACMSADPFAEILLDLGYERVPDRQIKAAEGVICRLKTPRQGTGVVALGGGNPLIRDFRRPEFVDRQSLGDPQWRQVGVGPGDGAVPVQLGIVAVPRGRAVVSLRVVVVSVAVSAHVEQLVLGAARSLAVELGDLMLEALPLGQVVVRMEGGVGWICAVDEAEICGHEIESASVGRGFVLQEVPCDCSVIDVRC